MVPPFLARFFVMATTTLTLLSVPLEASEFRCEPKTIEKFSYSWRLRGGLSWVAGLRFPTSGFGALRTSYLPGPSTSLSSELLITPPAGTDGFYIYQSEIDPSDQKTLASYSGYSWGDKQRKERTLFDYVKRLARTRRESVDAGEEQRVRPIPPREMRDIVTGIYYLRQHAGSINDDFSTDIYSDGKVYPVLFKPGERKTFTFGGEKLVARQFDIVSAPGTKKRRGDLRVWISEDERRIPVRIDIVTIFASLQLDLKAIEDPCKF